MRSSDGAFRVIDYRATAPTLAFDFYEVRLGVYKVFYPARSRFLRVDYSLTNDFRTHYDAATLEEASEVYAEPLAGRTKFYALFTDATCSATPDDGNRLNADVADDDPIRIGRRNARTYVLAIETSQALRGGCNV